MGTTICFPWGSLPLVTFLLLQSMVQLSSACSMEERAVLMDIRSSLRRAHSMVSPDLWGHDDDECCSWKTAVTCNNSTRRVTHLDLSLIYAPTDAGHYWYLNLSVFSAFHELQSLDLSFNYGCSLSFEALNNLRNLRELNMSMSGLSGNLPASLFALPHLKVLDLSNNIFDGYIPISSSSRPISLEVLDLSSNHLTGILPITGKLKGIYLYSKKELHDFIGPIPINQSSNLSLSLKSLRLSQNKLSGRFSFIWLADLIKLEEIDLSGNANLVVHVNIPEWTPPFQLKQLLLSDTQHHLEVLDLSNNNLSASMPNWLFTKEATLHELYLGNNSLTGSLDPIWHTQSSLQVINLHMNHVTGQLPANISSMFPRLQILDLSSNNFFGHIPTSLCKINFMTLLDLSNNKFSGEVPACVFTNYPILVSLKVSNNKLGGLIFGGMNNLSIRSELYLDGNKFEGAVPCDLSGGTLMVIDLHDNELSGKVDTSLWNMSSLKVLNLAGNRITGKIHPQICGFTRLELLDISSNNLTGSVPNCSCMLLHFLNLSGNSLSSHISYPFFNTSSLIALDIRNNQFAGNLDWVRSLDNIRLLSLGGNKFEGQVTTNLCELQHLRIIDLSHNKLSGSLPSCIGSFFFKGDRGDQIFQVVLTSLPYSLGPYNNPYGLKGFSFTTKGNMYTYGRSFFVSMSGIDLSANMLHGEIPWELGNMSHIKSLNLSYNFFVGPIPTTFGGMEEIESLDLSHNELSGPIPWQLARLCSLGVFSVAYNNLSGCIPNSGQLGSFGMDSYLANTDLHKITHGNMCTPSPDPMAEEDVGETSGDPILYMVMAAGFILAFWATVAFSLFHPYGRSVMFKL
ncbi:hypothetical protein ZWY2020_006872 [Hordeum vulgare]|nr:hypothetical protein ZWY2020_006872 [Hordeum vulgare]